MLNKVMLIGNLGQDPELRNTASGTAVCTIRLCTNERRKNAQGEWVDHAEWHTIVCWDKTAENVTKFCQKGKQLYVEGKLQTRKWQDKNGADRYSTEIVADVVRFLGGGSREGGGESQHGRGGGQGRGSDGGDRLPYQDEDIPF